MKENAARRLPDPEPAGQEDGANAKTEDWAARIPTAEEDLDWSGLLDQETAEAVPESETSGLRRTLAPQELEMARAQEKAVRTSGSMTHALNDLLEGFEDPALKGRYTALIRRFYAEIAEISHREGLDPGKSNVLRMLEGLRHEFEAILTAPPNIISQEAKDKRLKSVRRVLSDLMNALLAVRSEGRWESIEEAVPEILHLLPLKKGQLADLALGFLQFTTREQALAVLEGASREVPDPAEVIQRQLDEFASGNVTLAQIKMRQQDWEKLWHKAESLPGEHG